MSYTMRFVQTDDQPITIESINAALQSADKRYQVNDGRLSVGDSTCAEIKIVRKQDSGFGAKINDLRELATKAAGRGKKRVLQTLDEAQALVVVQVLWEECEPEETLQKIDPLWAWLFDNAEGLVQADDEGFYERSKRILAVD
jgi:hypothetical protein